jgi:hypothetical protein
MVNLRESSMHGPGTGFDRFVDTGEISPVQVLYRRMEDNISMRGPSRIGCSFPVLHISPFPVPTLTAEFLALDLDGRA